MATSKVAQVLKEHIPLIKFRKGSSAEVARHAQSAFSPAQASFRHAVPTASLESWQLPERFKRRPIDEYECNIINMGGRDRPFE